VNWAEELGVSKEDFVRVQDSLKVAKSQVKLLQSKLLMLKEESQFERSTLNEGFDKQLTEREKELEDRGAEAQAREMKLRSQAEARESALQLSLQGAQTREAALEDQVKTLQESINKSKIQFELKITELQEEKKAELLRLRQDFVSLENSKSQINGELTAVKFAKENGDSEVEVLRESLRVAKESNESIKGLMIEQREEHNAIALGLQEQLRSLNTSLEASKATTQTFKAARDALSHQVEELSLQAAATEEALTVNLREEQERRAIAEARSPEALMHTCEFLKAELAELRANGPPAGSEARTVKELNALRAEMSALRPQLGSLREANRKLEEENAKLKEERVSMTPTVLRMMSSKNVLKTSLNIDASPPQKGIAVAVSPGPGTLVNRERKPRVPSLESLGLSPGG